MNNQNNETKTGVENKNPTPQTNVPNKTLAEPISASISEGLNLIPEMTKTEVAVEKTKSTVNIGSILALIALVVISLGIVGFNIISKVQLNSKKTQLYNYENVLGTKIDTINANNSIVDRVFMYKKVEEGRFSHKEVVDFLKGIMAKSGKITLKSIEISDSLQIEFTGNAPTLEEVSKLWYLLGIDEKIETVNLDSVGKGDNDARFTFTAQLSKKEFLQ